MARRPPYRRAMPLPKRLAPFVAAALLALALSAAPASADDLRQTGAAVATPFALNTTSTTTTFNGVFAAGSVSCSNAALDTTITTNNVFGSPVTGDLGSWTFAGCTVAGVACGVVANALPWVGAVRMDYGAPKTYAASFPAAGSLTITCFPAGAPVTCTYVGAVAAPPTAVKGVWTDSLAGKPARIAFLNSPLAQIAPSAGACAAAPTFSGSYFTVLNDFTLTP
jgi:hypothetical protein